MLITLLDFADVMRHIAAARCRLHIAFRYADVFDTMP